MNLGNLIEQLEFQSGFKDSAYRGRWKVFLNMAVREWARRRPWDGLEDTTTLTSDGTKYLILPPYVDSVVSLLNKSQNLPVDRSGDWDREATAVYSQQTAGTVINYDRLGDVPCLRAPTGFLWVSSSHASDLQTLNFTGVVSNSGASGTGLGETYKTLSVASTGTSPVTLSVLFTKLISVSKSTDSNGDFFIYDAGNANAHISFLGRYEDDARFKRLQLMFVPSAQTLFELRFRYKIPKLTQDEQAPHPSVLPDFLIQYALSKHFEEREQLQKAAIKQGSANAVLEAEANKDHNFDEPHSQIIPYSARDREWTDDRYYSW